MKELGTFKWEQGQSERQIGDTNNLKSKWTIVSEVQQKDFSPCNYCSVLIIRGLIKLTVRRSQSLKAHSELVKNLEKLMKVRLCFEQIKTNRPF